MVENSSVRLCEFVLIKSDSMDFTQSFFKIAGYPLNKFRYFEMRPISIIEKLITSLILISEVRTIALSG